jgi:hypothetical protein
MVDSSYPKFFIARDTLPKKLAHLSQNANVCPYGRIASGDFKVFKE